MAIPLYDDSPVPTLPGLFMRLPQLDAVVQVRNWAIPRGGDLFNGSAGTGVLIGSRLVLTAKHVVAERTRERANATPAEQLDVCFGVDVLSPTAVVLVRRVVVMNPGELLELSTLARSSPLRALLELESADLALLLLDSDAPAEPIPLGTAPVIGERVQLGGFGRMAVAERARGWVVASISHLSDDRSGFMVNAPGEGEADTGPGPGDSGGPAIAASPSGSAEVVGIVSGGAWLFPELQRRRMELYVSTYHYRDWIRGAIAELMDESSMHDVVRVGTVPKTERTSTTWKWVLGIGAGVLLLLGLAAIGGKRERG